MNPREIAEDTRKKIFDLLKNRRGTRLYFEESGFVLESQETTRQTEADADVLEEPRTGEKADDLGSSNVAYRTPEPRGQGPEEYLGAVEGYARSTMFPPIPRRRTRR